MYGMEEVFPRLHLQLEKKKIIYLVFKANKKKIKLTICSCINNFLEDVLYTKMLNNNN